jgi:CheY-like chemotaxis protein
VSEHSTASENRRRDERRRLVERRAPAKRRSGVDRRKDQRRKENRSVLRERRSGLERRSGRERRRHDERREGNRRLGRRRRETPTPYTAEHVAAIQRAHTTSGIRPRCPTCGGAFALGRPRHRKRDVIRQVRCVSCGKSAIVTNSRPALVMVIAREEIVRHAVRAILSPAGHEVLEAADAAVGLWAYDEKPADVVFIDVHSPGKPEAGEFIRQLRREHPDARIVAMSRRRSYGVADPAAMATRLGAAGTVRMPFSNAEMLGALEAARP